MSWEKVPFIKRSVAAGVAGMLGFGLTVWALNRALPPLAVKEITPKLRAYTKSAKKYNTVMIGSSHVVTQLDPVLFDEGAKKHGLSTRTYNFGCTGLAAQEIDYLLERILAVRNSNHLRYVLMELNAPTLQASKTFADTTRDLYWHDLRRTSDVTEMIFARAAGSRDENAEPHPWLNAFAAAGHHWKAFLQRATHLGQATEWIAVWGGKRPLDARDFKTTAEGFFPLHMAISPKDSEAVRAAVQSFRNSPPSRQGVDLQNVAMARLIACLRARGIQPVYFVSPNIVFKNAASLAQARALGVPVLSFDDPAKFPALYEDRYRADTKHLNAAGAQIFTPLVAEHFAKSVAASATKP